MMVCENQVGLRPAFSLLVGNDDKGNSSNRANWLGSRFGNALKTAAKDAVIIGGTIGVVKSLDVGKFSKVTDALVKGVDTCTKFLEQKFGYRVRTEEFTKICNASSKAKAKCVVAALGLLSLGVAGCKANYKFGRIDQKYSDQAKLDAHQR